MSKIFISCALPYANGPCHLGHIRSTYLPADIFARYNRMIGNDVLMVCATDEHGTPIAVKADKENKKPIEISKRYHDLIVKDVESMNISLDNFTRTTDEKHYEIAQNFFKDLYDKDLIYREDIQQLYCPNCNKFLPDRYVEGLCPVCGSEARGDHCEKCGKALDPTELDEPHCITCGTTPIIKDTFQYAFKLSEFEDTLKDYINNNENLPANVKNYATNWLNEGLNDWILTRDMDWGIPVPLDEAKGKVLYVWIEAFLGYISSASQWAEKSGDKWEEYWNDYVVHFIGKDIIYHHSIFWPGLLSAYGCKLPDMIYAGEFLSLEGEKMSTSKNWVIWIADFVKDYDPDLLRYYLTINAPLNRDSDFSWDDFQRRNNDELADVIGNFLHRTFVFTKKYFDSKIPEYVNPNDEDEEFRKAIEALPDTAGEYIANYEFREALLEIFKVAKKGNKYFNDCEPWKAVKEDMTKAANCLYLSNQLAKTLAYTLKPFLPTKADRIAEIMNIDSLENWNDAKVQEYHDRRLYNISRSVLSHKGPLPDVSEKTDTQDYSKNTAGPLDMDHETSSAIYLFKTPTCPNCRAAGAMLEKAGISYSAINANEDPELVKKFGIKQAPTLVLVTGGTVEKIRGVSDIKGWISKSAAGIN